MELGPLKCIHLGWWYLNLRFEVGKLKRFIQSPGFDEIPTELIKGRGETVRSAMRRLFNYVSASRLLMKKVDRIVTIKAYRSYQLHVFFSQV